MWCKPNQVTQYIQAWSSQAGKKKESPLLFFHTSGRRVFSPHDGMVLALFPLLIHRHSVSALMPFQGSSPYFKAILYCAFSINYSHISMLLGCEKIILIAWSNDISPRLLNWHLLSPRRVTIGWEFTFLIHQSLMIVKTNTDLLSLQQSQFKRMKSRTNTSRSISNSLDTS